MQGSEDPVYAIAMIGHADADLLPFYLDHYRRLGIAGFVLAFHGDWDRATLDRLDGRPDVHIWDVLDGVYGDERRLQILNTMAESFRDQWVLQADADEFLELPCADLTRTIRALDVLGLDSLPALLVQRQTADGSLPAVDPARPLSEQFPCYHVGLCEEMGLQWPSWKAKYPLMRVTAGFRMRRGNHLPPHGRSIDHAPIRGVVHHFKWRASLHAAMRLPRGRGSNSHEMQVYETWLNEHGGRLPHDGARPCSREDLFSRGFLVRPHRGSLRIASLYRKIGAYRRQKITGRDSADDEQHQRLRNQLGRLERAFGRPPRAERERALTDPANLLLKPGRICLVTFELAPPDRSGGIATAMMVNAERLSAAGHQVDVLLCPFLGPESLWDGWIDYWAVRGVRVHYLPRKAGAGGTYRDQFEFCQAICDVLEDLDPDMIHCVDAAGYAAFAALLKAAGLAFQGTRLMATAHGSTAWHDRGNRRPWSPEVDDHSLCHDLMMSLADVVCFPSRYMHDVLADTGLRIRSAIVVPNGLAGVTRSYRCDGADDPPRRSVDELVLFGRIEPRKGFDRFKAAIEALLHRGHRGFKVTLLGKSDGLADQSSIDALLRDERIVARHITNFNNVDAVNYLKSRNCMAVIASLRDNLPYTVYECLENGVPFVASPVGGIPELVDARDRPRCLIADDAEALVEALADALSHGAVPAKLAFDPDLAEIELLAIHARLVDDARRDRLRVATGLEGDLGHQPVSIAAFVYGKEVPRVTPGLIAMLSKAATDDQISGVHRPIGADVSGGQHDGISIIERMPDESMPAAINRLVEAVESDFLLLCHTSVTPAPSAFSAMHRLIKSADADAVVCSCRVGLIDDEHALTGPLLALGGPTAKAPAWNLFGAGFFLITRAAFERLGGFGSEDHLHELAHWVLLNRLLARGGRVVGIPKPLATMRIDRPEALADLADGSLLEALVRPWIETAAPHAETLIRQAAVVNVGKCRMLRTVRDDLARSADTT